MEHSDRFFHMSLLFLRSFIFYYKLSVDHTGDDQWLQERLQIYKAIVSAQQKKIMPD
jgi:hypothetical protein